MRIGIVCYPSVGGSGILAAGLGEELAARGHEVHFISYERPFRLKDAPRLHFHPVVISEYKLFRYPDYTLPLSVRMAEVSRDCGLDVLHVHYAVPHATSAILAREMLPPEFRPRVVTTLHGTDTTLLGSDPGYGPAIHHALSRSDAVTTVSDFLSRETRRVLRFDGPLEMIHNFFNPRPRTRGPEEVRRELGLKDELVLLHSSNLRPLKRIDLLLETVARLDTGHRFKLVILAGASFEPFVAQVHALKLDDRVIVRENVSAIEDYLQIADVGLFTSESESFGLSILEAMCFGVPVVARPVGGIPEVVQDGVSGLLVDSNKSDALARAVDGLLASREERARLGGGASQRAHEQFSAEVILPRYEALYRRVCGLPAASSTSSGFSPPG